MNKIAFPARLISVCLYGLYNNQLVTISQTRHAFLLFCHFSVTHVLAYKAIPVLVIFIYWNLFILLDSNHGPSFKNSFMVISG